MDVPDTCRLILNSGTYCGEPVSGNAQECKRHIQMRACPWPLPGGHPCGVAIKQGLDKVDPKDLPRHPHHKHWQVRMVVTEPEFRSCRVCRKAHSSPTGFCTEHDVFAAQTRREALIMQLEEAAAEKGTNLATLFREDRKEVLDILEATKDAESYLQKARKFGDLDVRDYQAITNPYEELYKLAGQVLAWKDALAERVAGLEQVGYEGRTGEQIAAEIQVFSSALTEARNLLVSIAKLDVEERMVRVAEAQAMMIAEVISRVLDSLGLDERTVLRARTSVADRLRVFGTQHRAITA